VAERPSPALVVPRVAREDVAAPAVVPFTDLAAMSEDVWPLIESTFMDALRRATYIGGPPVDVFEREWADYCGVSHAVGVANGTDALLLTLQGLGIGPGDEVVVPANTFIATAEAVVRAGARPRFADVSQRTLLLTPQLLAEAITPATRVAIVVHLFGQIPDMDGLQRVADEAGITLVEDAAQAHGARWRDRRAGSFGTAAAFSFYPGKNVGAFGDGGAVVTADPDLADRIRALANHGRAHGARHHAHDLLGTNSRLDALQAIVLSGKLQLNEEWTRRRIALADRYRNLLGGSGAVPVEVAPQARHVYHLFVVRVRQRERVRARLAERGIGTGLHYPVPCHRQRPLREYADRRLPVCEAAAGEILSLPMFPHLREEQVDQVCEALLEIVPGEVLTDVS
jgi:dTDP-4-amino-4,6-dideoxygalactose transaminase